jgi:hypothetical protein
VAGLLVGVEMADPVARPSWTEVLALIPVEEYTTDLLF